MKQETYSLSRLPVSIRGLKIRTNLRLHPEFSESPRGFARRRGVNLVGDLFPETNFKRDLDARYARERLEKIKLNIHLVRHNAIRLFAKREKDGCDRVVSIDLNPSLLLYGAKRYLLFEGDLLSSLNILLNQVSRLLADPLDARHIVPGLVYDEEPVAYWSLIDSELLLPGIQIPCLHDLSHPSTGPAEGVKKNRIQLGDKEDDCLIRFKKAKWESEGSDGAETVKGVRVRLILKGARLSAEFSPFGSTAQIRDTETLVAFSERSVANVHQAVTSRLEGMCLPVPPEWRDRDNHRPNKHAKTIALLSKLTSIPVDEFLAMDEEIRRPSKSTRRLLNIDIPIEVARLDPFPVATLFGSAVYALQQPGMTALPSDQIDPAIAEAYG